MNRVESGGVFPVQDLHVSTPHRQVDAPNPGTIAPKTGMPDFLVELVEVRQRIDRLLSQNLDSEQLRELGIVLQAQTEAVLWGLTELRRMGHRS